MIYLLLALALMGVLVFVMFRELAGQDPDGLLDLTPDDVAGERYPYLPTPARGPIVNGEQFPLGYTPEAAAYEQRTRKPR